MSKPKRAKLIDIVCSRYPWISREELLAAVLFGDVFAAHERCRDPKSYFSEEIEIGLEGRLAPLAADRHAGRRAGPEEVPQKPYVSRGGNKLAGILQSWNVPVAGRVWLDAGCSTGGFTHALLLAAAAKVHAVDVGYNVLDWRLRNLPQVIVHERCNIMGLERLDPPVSAAVADLSFRSIEGPAQKILALTNDNELYALIKPQFERKYNKTKPAGAEDASGSFSGVVSGHAERLDILHDLSRRLATQNVVIEKISEAGVKGRGGNQEYIALLRMSALDRVFIAAQSTRCIQSLASS